MFQELLMNPKLLNMLLNKMPVKINNSGLHHVIVQCFGQDYHNVGPFEA